MSEEWVKEAMDDAMLVAQVLLSLVRPKPPPPPPTPTPTEQLDMNNTSSLRLEWSVRQLRSKQLLRRKGETARASPTTPLSWNGGGTSGCEGSGADGSEESSRPEAVDNARSKVLATNETTTPPNKRSRKKKTLAELKEEMSSHLKENDSLKKDLEMVKLKLKNLRTTNESLSRKLKFEKDRATEGGSKRMKLDHHQSSESSVAFIEPKNTISDPPHQGEVACCHPTSAQHSENDLRLPKGSSQIEDVATCETSFMLPDLNLPVEE